VKKRIIGAVAAALLALVGTVLLVGYVGGAEQRAFAGVETAQVWVVDEAIPARTAAETVLLSSTSQAMPSKAIADGAVVNPSDITGLVTTVELVPGEQVLTSRFIDPATAEDPAQIEVPEGMQEVSILLEPQRSMGGRLTPGDTVGVFVSLATGAEQTPATVTHLTLHKVLVTAIQGLPPGVEGEETPDAAGVPAEGLIITVALTAPDAEKIVFAQEFGTIWLSKEPATATEEGTRELTQDGIHK